MISDSIGVRNNEFLRWFSSDFSEKGIFMQVITIIQCCKPIKISSFFGKMETPVSFAQIYPVFWAITKMLKMINLNKTPERYVLTTLQLLHLQ